MNNIASRKSFKVLPHSGILFLLAFVLLVQSAWAQRIGPLVPDNSQRSKASSAERKAVVGPPSLQLSLPSPAEVDLPPVAGRSAQAELLRRSRQDDLRGSVAIDRGQTPLASEDDLTQRPHHARSLSGLRHRVGKSLAPLGGRTDRRTLKTSGTLEE